jgi:hypothetical protein
MKSPDWMDPAQIPPEVGILLIEGLVTEHAVGLADHLVQPVAEAVQEILVGGDDGAIGLEVDDGQGFVQCRQQGLGALQGGLLLGHVGGDLGDLDHLAIEEDREVAGFEPDRLARFGCRMKRPLRDSPLRRSCHSCSYSRVFTSSGKQRALWCLPITSSGHSPRWRENDR